MATRHQLALAAAVGHAPLLVWLAGRPLRRRVLRANGVALACTALACGVAWATVGGSAAVGAWAVGHGLWSALLGRWAWRGEALAPVGPTAT